MSIHTANSIKVDIDNSQMCNTIDRDREAIVNDFRQKNDWLNGQLETQNIEFCNKFLVRLHGEYKILV